ncbi:MAG TPA: acetylxylan esterase [Chryseosolibacter sp.]|nr:acetylxylan esterase [Chryseosolibacter sp.]
MKMIIALCASWLVSLAWCTGLRAQADTAWLCQRDYFTEVQAKRLLDTLAQRYATAGAWEKRAAEVKAMLRAGMGLPKARITTPLNPIIRRRITGEGYTVENVAFESMPGFFVTGNLYRPEHLGASRPAVLAPHGHGKDPRFGPDHQILCATLARMGAVVLAYDMVGYGESDQCEHQHPRAMTLQSINSMRAVDLLLSLPEVDPKRLAVTGASGGGTQAFFLTALDDRIAVSVPVVMVSAHFFGGCVCESGMAVHRGPGFQTCNAEIAALAAPRPMLLISDGKDWTRNTPLVEYPFIRGIYELFGAEAVAENVHLPHEGHDYGPSKRSGTYYFLAKHLGLDVASVSKGGAIDETAVSILPSGDLEVFDEEYVRPPHAINGNVMVTELLESISGRSK